MKNILIDNEAARKIVREASNCPVETGGILLGILEPLVILSAGGLCCTARGSKNHGTFISGNYDKVLLEGSR